MRSAPFRSPPSLRTAITIIDGCPIAAYGLATAISLSRVTTSAHFPSDVFLGAALGYAIAKFQVLQH